ncbi:hypothetical protein [Alkalihalobacterium alkalinitrilicum]|uniref:hypothetical protein n=1 Tax=Alkalihalobacterium alkalinitrilicum TaxID=427920 RepID=UPI001EE48DAA|nr:hypothetical protein [Alkalihalobacterium alkalinitrilicum]
MSKFRIHKAFSGHGAQIEHPMVAIDAARTRYEKYLETPEKISWHAVKRIFVFTLII